MDQTELVADFIARGAAVIRALDDHAVPVPAAFWLYQSEDQGWRLIVATTIVDDAGPLEAYRRVLKLFDEALPDKRSILDPDYAFDEVLDRLTLVSPNEPIVQLLGSMVRTGHELSGIRFTNNTINGVFIPDAFIYRIDDPAEYRATDGV